MPRTDTPFKASRLIVLAAVCVTVAALYLARDVLIPLALAVLVSFLLAPLVQRLERRGLHRVPAVLVVFTVVLTLVAALGWVVYVQMIDLAERLPGYREDIRAKVRLVWGGEPGALTKAAETIEEVIKEPGTQPAADTQAADTQSAAASTQLSTVTAQRSAQRDDLSDHRPAGTGADLLAPPGAPITRSQPSIARPVPVTVVPDKPTAAQMLGAYSERLLRTLGMAGLVGVFVIFMLIQREDLRDRLLRLVGYGQLNVTTQALNDAASRISRYLLAQAIVNGTYGFAVSLGLWAIGYFMTGEMFPNFVLWGLLCALLRFIPYVGPWLAAAFPLALSFAAFPGYRVFVAVAVMFIVIELLSNNFMEPWLYGSSTGISTLAVIVAAVFWTWLWGPIGLVMATPLTVCLVVVGKYVPALKFFDVLLGDEPVLEPAEKVYQRLLAKDQEEAIEVAERYLEQQPLDQVFDTILLPALALAEADRHAGRLDDDRSRFIRNAMRQIIDELADQQRLAEVRQEADATARQARGQEAASAPPAQAGRSRLPDGCVINIVLLPAHDEADEIVALMLSALLDLRGYCAFPVSQTALASEMLDEVERKSADAVVVSALPPAAVAHARYLCKRLHTRLPQVNTLVALWTYGGDLTPARQRILCAQSVRFATTFSQALEQLHELVQPRILQSTPPVPTPASPDVGVDA